MGYITVKMKKVFKGSYEYTDSLGQTWRARTYEQATWADGDGWVLSCDEDFNSNFSGIYKSKALVVTQIEYYVNMNVNVTD